LAARTARKLWRHYFAGTNLLIWVVDSNDTQRMAESREELHALLKEDELRDAALLVYANKMDLPYAQSVSEVERMLDVQAFPGRKWHVQAASGTSGTGLWEGLEWASKALPVK
jgi:signal recognition particle receptor subunit beta